MKIKKNNSILLGFFLIATIFSTSCDKDFYLTEKEFYALRGQIITQSVANQVFGGVQGQQLQINFDNSVSPPRVQNTNLQDFMRNHLPSLAILEGYPSNSLRIERVSGEIEKQFDNWLATQLRLYGGANNARVRLERVEAMRVQFMNNPTFVYSTNKIMFTTTLQITGDCRIKVDALDPVTNFLFGGINGTYDVAIDINNLQLQGEIALDLAGDAMASSSSNLRFKLTPTVGSVVVLDRGIPTPNAVRNGIRDVVRQSLKAPIEEKFNQQYDFFALSKCRINGEFTCEYDSPPSSSTPELHAVARGTDNKLYAAIRRNDVWSNYTEICCNSSSQIQFFFTSDPSLAVSSAGTVELAATTSTGEIFYGQYQNGWKNYRFVMPVIPPGTPTNIAQGLRYTGKPTIVATAPGQIEIVVARVNGTLVHLRRINGNWTAPTVLNLPTSTQPPNPTALSYRDPIAVQSGNYLSLIAKTNGNRLYVTNYNLEIGMWSPGSPLATVENVNYAPALAASGDGRIDLVYVGQSGTLYHRYLSNLLVSNVGGSLSSGFSSSYDVAIPSLVNATPILVASGYRQLGLVARGTDNRLYYNHFTGTQSPTGLIDGRNVVQGWSGWSDLNGNFYGTQLLSNEYTEEFAVSATKTGKLDVVARIRANTFSSAYTLHHNGYDAAKFGNAPWKTVHWRGYHNIGNRQFNGRPALAALDGNFEIAFVGQGNNIYNSQQGNDFTALLGLQVLSYPAPVDPLVITSGKGLVDLIAVGTDQKIKHVRYYNNLGLQTPTLPGQTNLNFQRRPAVVGYGDGQMDVIGVSTTGSIHYWRYLNGVWQNPQQISGFVTSSPILVSTGAGQLELFAVGGDNKLYRWRFLGGAWGNWQQIPSTFTVNPNKFGQGSATTWGDGTVDLAVVTNQAGVIVYHRHVEPRDDTVSLPNLPAQNFRSIGSGAETQLFIGALNQREKFVVVKDAFNPRFNYYWLASGGVWQTDRILGNNLELRIGGLARYPNGWAAVATDVNGKIYFHNRLTAASPRFDFAPVIEQNTPSQLRLPLYRPAIASYGGQ